MGPIPSDAETLTLYEPPDEFSKEVNDHVTTCALAQSLRQDPDLVESRPHLKIPASIRSHNLTGGTLSGPGMIVVPPLNFSDAHGRQLTSIFYLGSDVSGHPGIVHGGLLATMLDEGLARCCFGALPNKVGVTANLEVRYKKPTMTGQFLVLRARTTKVEGRKAWVEGWIEPLEMTPSHEQGEHGVNGMSNGEVAAQVPVVNGVNGVEREIKAAVAQQAWEPERLVEGNALFIEPKHAAMMKSLYKVT